MDRIDAFDSLFGDSARSSSRLTLSAVKRRRCKLTTGRRLLIDRGRTRGVTPSGPRFCTKRVYAVIGFAIKGWRPVAGYLDWLSGREDEGREIIGPLSATHVELGLW